MCPFSPPPPTAIFKSFLMLLKGQLSPPSCSLSSFSIKEKLLSCCSMTLSYVTCHNDYIKERAEGGGGGKFPLRSGLTEHEEKKNCANLFPRFINKHKILPTPLPAPFTTPPLLIPNVPLAHKYVPEKRDVCTVYLIQAQHCVHSKKNLRLIKIKTATLQFFERLWPFRTWRFLLVLKIILQCFIQFVFNLI